MKRTLLWKRARRGGNELDLNLMRWFYAINQMHKTIPTEPQQLTILYTYY